MNVEITDLDKEGYRKFGLVTGAIFASLFGLIIPLLFSTTYIKWPWILSAILVASALIAPMSLKYPYRIWMQFGLVMNWINTRLILGILFYGLFLPIGLLFKLIGKDPMHRKLDKNVTSYRQHNAVESKSNVERPY
jgi:Kef-type K+ transport system membrane component KefB